MLPSPERTPDKQSRLRENSPQRSPSASDVPPTSPNDDDGHIPVRSDDSESGSQNDPMESAHLRNTGVVDGPPVPRVPSPSASNDPPTPQQVQAALHTVHELLNDLNHFASTAASLMGPEDRTRSAHLSRDELRLLAESVIVGYSSLRKRIQVLIDIALEVDAE